MFSRLALFRGARCCFARARSSALDPLRVPVSSTALTHSTLRTFTTPPPPPPPPSSSSSSSSSSSPTAQPDGDHSAPEPEVPRKRLTPMEIFARNPIEKRKWATYVVLMLSLGMWYQQMKLRSEIEAVRQSRREITCACCACLCEHVYVYAYVYVYIYIYATAQ
jgi:hypothetical protein